MLDINLLRKDLDGVVARLAMRKSPQPFLDVERFRALEAERKTIQTRTEELQARRNSLSKQIGQLKGKGEDTAAPMAEVAGIGDALKASAERLGTPAHLVDAADQLRPEWFEGHGRVGLTAGASAPELLVQQVIERLRSLGAVSVRRMAGVEETVHFPLPKGLGDRSMEGVA